MCVCVLGGAQLLKKAECVTVEHICDFQADDRQTEGLLNRTYNFNRIGNGTSSCSRPESQSGRKEGQQGTGECSSMSWRRI